MKLGDPIVVTAHWSSFYKMHGKVTQLTPHVMVKLEGDLFPIRVGEREIAVVERDEHITGGG